LQAEVEAKTRKLRKLFTKLQTVKQEIVDVTEEYNRDRRDLEDTQQQLLKELKLKMLIIDNFISPSDKEKLMSRAAYDDETDLWILQPNAKGTIHILRKHVKTNEFLFQHFVSTKFSCCSLNFLFNT
jgi:kinesin family protein 3/17